MMWIALKIVRIPSTVFGMVLNCVIKPLSLEIQFQN